MLAAMMRQTDNCYKPRKQTVSGDGGGGEKISHRAVHEQPGSIRGSALGNVMDKYDVVRGRRQEEIDRQNRVSENGIQAKLQLHIDNQQKSIENLSSALADIKGELECRNDREDQLKKMFVDREDQLKKMFDDRDHKNELRIKALEEALSNVESETKVSSYIKDLEHETDEHFLQIRGELERRNDREDQLKKMFFDCNQKNEQKIKALEEALSNVESETKVSSYIKDLVHETDEHLLQMRDEIGRQDDRDHKNELRIKALEDAHSKVGHETKGSSFIKDWEQKMDENFMQIRDEIKSKKIFAAKESKHFKIQNALLADRLRIVEDELKMEAVSKAPAPIMMQLPPCNCKDELAALKYEFERFKIECTQQQHVKNSFTTNDVANGKYDRNYEMLLRKYDKLKARLVSVEREATNKNSSTSCDANLISSIVHAITSAMSLSTASRCCGGGGGGWPRRAELTTPPTNNYDGMKESRVSSSSNFVSEPQAPVQNIPPPPAAPKTAPKDGSKKDFERIPITTDLLKAVTLAKKGEPVKKIKLPPGMLIAKRKTVTSDDAVAPAPTSSPWVTPPPAPPLPTGSFCPPPAPPLPTESGSFCPPPAPPLPTVNQSFVPPPAPPLPTVNQFFVPPPASPLPLKYQSFTPPPAPPLPTIKFNDVFIAQADN